MTKDELAAIRDTADSGEITHDHPDMYLLLDEVERFRGQLAACSAGPWIYSHDTEPPKDGTKILCDFGFMFIQTAYYRPKLYDWHTVGGTAVSKSPLRWARLNTMAPGGAE